MIRFVAVVLGTGVCVAIAVIVASQYGCIAATPSYYAESLIILATFTIVICRYLDRISDPGIFVQVYLLSMVVKLLAYGVYVVLMILDDRAGANRNVLFFLVLYVIFTALEVGFLHRKITGNRPR